MARVALPYHGALGPGDIDVQRHSRALATLVCLGSTLAIPRSVHAQTPSTSSTEFFGGYSYLRDPGASVLTATEGDDSFPLGWAAGAARPVRRAIAVVGDVSGQYKTRTTFDNDVKLSFHAFMAGPRASATIGRVAEFAQILVGAVHARGSGFGVTTSLTTLGVQPGGGIDYPLGSRFAARLELDYRWIKGSAEGREAANQLRAIVAVVYR